MTDDQGGDDGKDAGYRRGVGIVLLNRERLVFVGRRIDRTEEAWQMPQGGIDPGETPADAARRELQEETGTDKAELLAESAGWLRYDLPAARRGALWRGRYRGQMQKWFAMGFLGADGDFNLGTHHAEFNAWQWVARDRLDTLIVPFKRELYRAVLAEFAPLWQSA